MTNLVPVNNHLLIEPIKHEGFMASQRSTYQEIGVVIAIPPKIESIVGVQVGDKVYFDAWLAAKYPKEGGTDEEFYWLVKWEDVRAVEYVEQIPK